MKLHELKPLQEDVFLDKDMQGKAALNNPRSARSKATPGRIQTTPRRLFKRTSQRGGFVTLSAWQFDSDPKSTDLLQAFKGKGEHAFDAELRQKFIKDTATYMASEFKKMSALKGIDLIITPDSTSPVAREFAQELSNFLDVKQLKIGAFKKTMFQLPEDKAEALEAIKRKFIDTQYFNEKYTGDKADLLELQKSIYNQLKKGGKLEVKALYKPLAKFVIGMHEYNDEETLDGKSALVVDDVWSSGATMDDLFHQCMEWGAEKVTGATLFQRA